MENQPQEREKSRRGFAAMAPELQRQIASQGGRAAHQQGVAHQWSRQEAQEAGRKGWRAAGRKRTDRPDSSDSSEV